MSVGFGLLGAGRIGKVHATAIAATPGARLVAVADAVAAAADALAATSGAEVRTVDEIIAAADVAAVLIATPTDTHADLIERAARAGKAVFCEKPIDLDVERVRRCAAVVAETAAPVLVGFNRRFDPHLREVRAKLDAGVVGDVEIVRITSRDPAPPPLAYLETSGGLFRDMMIHDLDMARFLLRAEPTTVSAAGAVLVDPAIGEVGDIDSAAVVLQTASGAMAVIDNSRRTTYGYDQRVEVHGSAGRVAAQNLLTSTVEVANAAGTTVAPAHDFFTTRYAEAYAAEIAAFVEVVTAGAAPSPSVADGLAALVLADAAERAYRERRVVDVAEI